MPVLSRAWQMLLKGVAEVQAAPSPEASLEMVLIRLIHAAGLPTPADLLRRVETMDRQAPAAQPAPATRPAAPAPSMAATAPPPRPTPASNAATAAAAQIAPQAEAPAVPQPDPLPADFPAMAALFERRGEPVLHAHLVTSVHLVRYETGERPVLEFRPREGAPAALAGQIMGKLQAWTGRRWTVGISPLPGAPTLAEQGRQAQALAKEEAALHPTVRAVLENFPGATIVEVHDLAAEAEVAAAEAPADEERPDEEKDEMTP
jgi:DNA polymerase-3 subunit gamma/tau